MPGASLPFDRQRQVDAVEGGNPQRYGRVAKEGKGLDQLLRDPLTVGGQLGLGGHAAQRRASAFIRTGP